MTSPVDYLISQPHRFITLTHQLNPCPPCEPWFASRRHSYIDLNFELAKISELNVRNNSLEHATTFFLWKLRRRGESPLLPSPKWLQRGSSTFNSDFLLPSPPLHEHLTLHWKGLHLVFPFQPGWQHCWSMLPFMKADSDFLLFW